MAVQVDQQHVPSLMVGALAGMGLLLVIVVALNHIHAKGGLGGSVS